jgi:hypothetical protein
MPDHPFTFMNMTKGRVMARAAASTKDDINEVDHLTPFQDCHIHTVEITTDSQVTNGNLLRFKIDEFKSCICDYRSLEVKC